MHLLRHHADFRRLWLAQTISQIGSQISYLALPLTAAVTLGATPAEMGLLTAMGSMPALVVGLLAGAVVDRRPRRPILISSDLARAVLLAMIPLAWALDALSMPLLYSVAFLSGIGALFFDTAYQAFLPSVIERDDLFEGNSGLALGQSAAEVAGPSLAGWLIQLLKAPLAIAVDALSFLASAALIARIRRTEPARSITAGSTLWREALDGLRAVRDNQLILSLAIGSAAIGLFNAMIEAVNILYLTRTIGMEAGLLGTVFAAGSVGFILGAFLPGRLVARIGVGPTMAVAIAVVGLSDLALPLVGHNLVLVALAVAFGQFFFGLGLTVFGVAQTSIRQAIVPDLLMGRVGGTLRVLGWGMAPLGALLGGLLGQSLGLRPTLALAAALEAAVALWIWLSPLWALRSVDLMD